MDWELDKTPDSWRKLQVKFLSAFLREKIEIDEAVVARAKCLQKKGFRSFDALHLASAEKAKVDFCLTTDDKFLRLSKKIKNDLKANVTSPIMILEELLEL